MSSAPLFSRRHFFAMSASVTFAGLVAACGGKSGSSPSADGTLQVVKRFPNKGLVPGQVRLPISLGDKSGVLSTDSNVTLPDVLHASVIRPEDGAVVLSKLTAERHGENLSVAYWPFEFSIEKEGTYILRVDEAPDSDASFQIQKRSDIAMPLVGDPLPPFDTPTTENARGVNPICTRPTGTCPFHDITLTDALKLGKSVLYLIGTPAYCTSGTCSPALDALIEVSQSMGDKAVFVHADVYKDKTATEAAPAVQAYHLSYEPILYITDAQGVLVKRLDAVFDVKEMQAVLSAAGIS
jgi:hypothetical protein